MTETRARLARYLRQRLELGERELVLDRLTVADLERLLATPSPTRVRGSIDPQVAESPAPLRSGGAALPSRPAEAPAGAPAPGPTGEEILALPTLQAVRELSLGCPRCRLAETRSRVVFGEGNQEAEVLVVGEAPGAEEDRSGRPFVGRAGRLLDLLLASAGLPRETVYICNVLKCRPPGNRNPRADEVEACSPYLIRQLELVRPKVIAAMGTFAAQTLLGSTTPIGKLRGQVHEYRGIPLVASYHPAALLRTSAWIRPTWQDLQRVRSLLDSGP